MSIDKGNQLPQRFYMPIKGSEANTKIELLDDIFFVLYCETLLKVLPLEQRKS